MNIFPYSLGYAKPHRDQLAMFLSLAKTDTVGKHRIVEDHGQADIIIAFDQGSYLNFGNHYIEGKTFIYSTVDLGFHPIPGLFPSINTINYSPKFARSAPYIQVTCQSCDLDSIQPIDNNTDYLFSFVGNISTWQQRSQIFLIRDPRGLLLNTLPGLGNSSQYREQYLNSLQRSKFILCPRGNGVSSLRLFEAMRAGRVPVIISDDWVPPYGPDWSSFSIKVNESEIHRIPEILEAYEDNVVNMAQQARIEYNALFSSNILFNYLISQFEEMLFLQQTSAFNISSKLYFFSRLLDPKNIRTSSTWLKSSIRKRLYKD